jgi:hypothetical protein
MTTPPTPLQAAWYFQPERRLATATAAKTARPKLEQEPVATAAGKTSSQLETGSEVKPTRIEIALVNRGARRLAVERVIVNRDELHPARRWSFERAFEMQPGDFRILSSDDFTTSNKQQFSEACVLPVSISVVLRDDTRNDLRAIYGPRVVSANGELAVELAGRMPSALPAEWARCTP